MKETQNQEQGDRLVAREGRERGEEEVGVPGCKLLYTGWINNKVRLHRELYFIYIYFIYLYISYISYCIIKHNGKAFLKKRMYIDIYVCVCIYMYTLEPLSCIAEINITS